MRIHVPALILSVIASPLLAQSKTEIAVTPQLKIYLLEQAQQLELVIESSATLSAPSLFDLPKPPRTVLDVPEIPISLNKHVELPQKSLVRGIRVGSHPGKLRIVVDQKADGSRLGFERIFDSHQIRLVYRSPVPAITLGSPTPTTTPTPQNTPVPTPSLTPSISISATSTPSPAPTQTAVSRTRLSDDDFGSGDSETSTPRARGPVEQPVVPSRELPTEIRSSLDPASLASPTPQASASVAPTLQHGIAQVSEAIALVPATSTPTPSPLFFEQRTLLGFNFNFTESGDGERKPLLELPLSQRGEYRFAKRSEREFVVTLPKAALVGNHLELPHFPPQDFIGVDAVQAKKTDTGVEVVVLAERGYRLQALPVGEAIVIKALPWP